MTVSMVALVGPNGEIGHSSGERPVFEGVRESMDWFMSTTHGGVVVVGRVTVDQMIADGVDLTALPYRMAIFTRKNGPPTPQDFLNMLDGAFKGRPIFIAGGRKTYDAFLPFCTNFFIRKTSIAGSPDLFLPSLFSPRGTIH